MKVLYINPLFHTAIKAEQIPLKEVVKYENLQKYFSYDDISAMELETYLIVNSSALKRYELQSIFEDRSNTAPAQCSADGVYKPFIYSLSEIELEELRVELSNATYKCEAVDGNTIVLYADSAESPHPRETIENVFNALALIMPVNSVLQSRQYQQYMLSGNVTFKG